MELCVSIGEALDKFSILQIKSEEIVDPGRLVEVRKEQEAIAPKVNLFISACPLLYKLLLKVNRQLWHMLEEQRKNSSSIVNKSSAAYGHLCAEIMEKNASRYRLKQKLDTRFASTLKEQKSYRSQMKNFGPHSLLEWLLLKPAIMHCALRYEQVILHANPTQDLYSLFGPWKDLIELQICDAKQKEEKEEEEENENLAYERVLGIYESLSLSMSSAWAEMVEGNPNSAVSISCNQADCPCLHYGDEVMVAPDLCKLYTVLASSSFKITEVHVCSNQPIALLHCALFFFYTASPTTPMKKNIHYHPDNNNNTTHLPDTLVSPGWTIVRNISS